VQPRLAILTGARACIFPRHINQQHHIRNVFQAQNGCMHLVLQSLPSQVSPDETQHDVRTNNYIVELSFNIVS
jgi:hypothetical protein